MKLVQPIPQQPPSRVLCFDLENKPGAYWIPDGPPTAIITAIGWKWGDEPQVNTLLLLADGSFVDDNGAQMTAAAAFTSFIGELEAAALVYGHNIRRHDFPLIASACLRLRIRLPKPLRNTDTLRDYPKRNGMSASLANLTAMYGLDGEKKGMTQHDWEQANALLPEGVALARERVVGDVLLQEQLRTRLLELGVLGQPRVWTARR